MKKPIKFNWKQICIGVALFLVIAFAITTTIILNDRQKKLAQLEEENEKIKPDEEASLSDEKIIFKNFEIFIDKGLYF